MTFNRSVISRTIIGAALLVAIFVAVLPSTASVGGYSIGCSSTTMQIVNPENTNEVANGTMTVTANGEVIAIVETPPNGEFTAVATYTLPAGDYTIVAVWDNTSQLNPVTEYTVSDDITCTEDTVESDYGRICFGSGEVASAVYLYPDGLEIYSIANDEGVLSISVSSEKLYGTASDPAGDVVIATADDVLATTLYRQIDGNFRVVVGPEASEGKVFECVFNASCSRSRSWLPGQEPFAPIDMSVCDEAAVIVTPIVTPVVTPTVK